MHQLESTGRATLTSARASAEARRARRIRQMTWIFVGVGVAGVLAVVIGAMLGERAAGVVLFLVLVGGIAAFLGLFAGLLLLIVGRLLPGRDARPGPVVLDATGVVLRGVGPIPWAHLGPPTRLTIYSKNDVSGSMLVMPLTNAGVEGVATLPGTMQLAVGPKPYLELRVKHLLLPGLEGFAEDEVVTLFAHAHARFSGARAAGAPTADAPGPPPRA